MRRYIYLMIAVVAVLSACQREEQVRYASLKITSVVADAGTKAVTAEDMTVFIDGENFHQEYAYSELPSLIDVPVDKDIPYLVSAENMTVEEAETLPDSWGQIRYAGSTQVLVDRFMTKDDNGENTPLYYSVTVNCIVANSMLSVVFDRSVLTYYTDPKVSAFTDEDRVLEFTPENAQGAVAHFTAGQPLYFRFSGFFNISEEDRTYMDMLELEPAMHYTLTFKMTSTEGSLGKPEITVVETCEDIYETMTVDPSDDGVFDK